MGPIGTVAYNYWDLTTGITHRFWHISPSDPPWTHWKPLTKEVFRIELDSPYKLMRVDRGMPLFEGLGYLNPISRTGA